MTFPEAGSVTILSCPRLSVSRLIELRALVDRLMASDPPKQIPGGVQSDEAMEAIKPRSLQHAARTSRGPTNNSSRAAEGALLIEAMSTTKIATVAAPLAAAAGNNGADHGEATDDE
jgi:hypothetical protein